ncbi:MAG: hypothetical protein GY715_01195 [Planctomycetes bacterium]|nr:hypothetical protein [Planctomycetota bacterium]
MDRQLSSSLILAAAIAMAFYAMALVGLVGAGILDLPWFKFMPAVSMLLAPILMLTRAHALGRLPGERP